MEYIIYILHKYQNLHLQEHQCTDALSSVNDVKQRELNFDLQNKLAYDLKAKTYIND